MVEKTEKDFCFCTLTMGNKYRQLTSLLAKDIEEYSPGTTLIIFTDKPSDFSNYKNVIAYQYKRHDVAYHYERRFAIAKALSMFNSCIYMDGDMRICAPVPPEMKWLPGITAISCTSMIEHIKGLLEKTNPPRPNQVKAFEFYQKMARKVDLDIEADQVIWINESLFVVTKDGGKEIEFLKLWDKLAIYADLHGYHDAPCYPIGLAAKKTGFTIRRDMMEGLDYFDDRIEKVRISKGQSDPNAKKVYFEMQKSIENPQRTIAQKILNKLSRKVEYFYHLNRVKLMAMIEDFDFYYR